MLIDIHDCFGYYWENLNNSGSGIDAKGECK